MKAQLIEHGGCFEIVLEAETVKEAALIVRAGMNHTKDLRWVGSNVHHTGTITFSLVLGISRKSDSSVPKRS